MQEISNKNWLGVKVILIIPITYEAQLPGLANGARVKGLMIYISQASYDHSPPTAVGEGKRGKISIVRGPPKII